MPRYRVEMHATLLETETYEVDHLTPDQIHAHFADDVNSGDAGEPTKPPALIGVTHREIISITEIPEA